jgi:hypothetical protein
MGRGSPPHTVPTKIRVEIGAGAPGNVQGAFPFPTFTAAAVTPDRSPPVGGDDTPLLDAVRSVEPTRPASVDPFLRDRRSSALRDGAGSYPFPEIGRDSLFSSKSPPSSWKVLRDAREFNRFATSVPLATTAFSNGALRALAVGDQHHTPSDTQERCARPNS